MSRESMQRIRDAEDRAVSIVEEARAEAKRMLEEAERDGAALYERVESETAEELHAMLLAIREKTASATERMMEEGTEEISNLRQQARLRHRSAEKIVIRGLEAKCR